MAIAPEHQFDLKAAANYLAEILNKDALSERNSRVEGAVSLPKFHGAAAWIDTFLYLILEVETSNGKTFVGFETLFQPEGTFQKYSVEYENVHDLWAYEIAGDLFLQTLSFEDPDRITWMRVDTKHFVPATWSDLLDFAYGSNRIWVRD